MAVETSEREMVQRLGRDEADTTERFTSLQPTYEDTVAPNAEDDWEFED